MVVVGTCQLVFELPDNHSLKGKRQVSRSLIQRIRNRFNVAVAEVADQDHWQLLSLGVCCVTDSGRHANQVLSNVLDFIEDEDQGAVLRHSQIEILRT